MKKCTHVKGCCSLCSVRTLTVSQASSSAFVLFSRQTCLEWWILAGADYVEPDRAFEPVLTPEILGAVESPTKDASGAEGMAPREGSSGELQTGGMSQLQLMKDIHVPVRLVLVVHGCHSYILQWTIASHAHCLRALTVLFTKEEYPELYDLKYFCC